MSIYTEEAMLARYQELCDKRDRLNRQIEPTKKVLENLNTQISALQDKQKPLIRELGKVYNTEWFLLKKEIATLAKVLGRVNGPLAKK